MTKLIHQLFSFLYNKAVFFAFAYVIFPLVVLSFYNHEITEDFALWEKIHTNGFWEAQKLWYQTWSGRYFSNILISLASLGIESAVFQIVPFLYLVALFFTFYKLIGTFFNPIHQDTQIKFSLFLMIWYLYPIHLLENVFWVSSVLIYEIPALLLLHLIIILNKIEPAKPKIFLIPIIILLIFAIIGSNEVLLVATNAVLLGRMAHKIWYKQKIAYYDYLFILAMFLADYLLLGAQGNMNRVYVEKTSFIIQEHFMYFVQAYRRFFSWLISYDFLLISILYIPFGVKIAKQSTVFWQELQKIPLVLLGLGSLFFLGISFYLTFYATGSTPPPRVQHLVFLFFLLLYFLNIQAIILRYASHFTHSYVLPSYVPVLVGIILLYHLFQSPATRQAYQDLLSGNAQKYDQQLRARYEFLRKDTCQECEIERISIIPAAFAYPELAHHQYDFRNTAFSIYFNKKSVWVRKN